MTITFDEAFEFRDVQRTDEEVTQESTYIINTTVANELADEGEALTYSVNNLPLVLDGLARNSIEAVERINDYVYRVRVGYKSPGPIDEEDEEITEGATDSFDTTGGIEHISYGITRVDAAGKPSSEIGAAINYDGENVNGVDITVPRYGFSKKIKIPDSFVDESLKMAIFQDTGKVNSIEFEGFAAGEVLFLGAQGTKQITFDDIEDEWEITYHFQAQKSRIDILFNQGQSDEFKIDYKKGWDYIWVQYQKKEDQGQQQIVSKAIAAYVVQVYEEVNFQFLGLGFF